MTTAPSTGVVSGLAWTLTGMMGTRTITLAGLAVLARLLAPDDFGILAFALAYITYVAALGDLGTTMALIYWPGRTHQAAQVTFAAAIASGCAWLGLTALFAPAIAGFFGHASGAPVLMAVACSVPIQALGSTHEALCRKSLRFSAWIVPELGLAAAKALVSIVLALNGFGVWSLVWGHLAGHVLRTILLWLTVPWRPTLTMPWGLVRPMFAYGRSIVAVNVLAVVVHHADLLIVARLLGVTALGFYQMAAKVPEMTITVLVRAVSSVLFPALSRVHASGGDAAATWLRALQGIGLAVVPAAVGLIALAEPIVVMLFGPQWTASIPAVQALAAVACLRAIGTPGGDLLKASGRPGALVVLAVVKAVLLVPALLFGAPYGLAAVAVAVLAVTVITAISDTAAACVVTGTPARVVMAALRPAAVAGSAVAAALLIVDAIVGAVPAPVHVAAGGIAGAVCWASAVRLGCPVVYAELRQLMRRAGARGIIGQASRPSESRPRLAAGELGN